MMQYVQADNGRFLVPYVPKNTRKTQVLLPEGSENKKYVAYKMRLKRGEPWYGDWRLCPYNLELDEPGQDGLSLRHQIHIWMSGIMEAAYPDTWIYQDSDQMHSSVFIEEWPEIESKRDFGGRWKLFVRHEP